ncbi:putative Ig domain-containing protein [Nonomuraea sediminis]|uniref:putative Ig domain-containing protein n=1 Tax=Nonomuraea sediminis TaxID=2835864 RepID=UPI001BDCFC35|nr:putative Ig domain-containing protein [Nonomuraea sediminis]
MSSSTSANTQMPKSFKVGVQLMQDAVPADAVSVGTGAYNQEALFANPFKQAREEALVINKDGKLTYLERTEGSDTGWDQAEVSAATGTFSEVVVAVHPTGDVWAFAAPVGGGDVQSFVLVATGAGPNGTVECGWTVRQATATPWTVAPNVAPQALAVSYSPDAGPLVMGAALHNGLYISSLSASPKAFVSAYYPWVLSGSCSIAAQSGRLVGGGFVPVIQHDDVRRKSYVYYVMDGSVLRRLSTAEGAGVTNETVSSTVKQFCGTYNVPNLPQYAPQGDIGYVFLDAGDSSLVTGYGGRLPQHVATVSFESARAWQDADGKLHIFGQDAAGSLNVLHQADWLYGHQAVHPVWTQALPERPLGPGIDGWDCLNTADQLFAFDYEGSGKADHLVAYRPVDGQAKVWVMKRTADGFKEVLSSTLQNFPYPLGTGDLMCPFDYRHTGKLDHVAVYRPGTGKVTVLKANAAQARFDTAYSSNTGIGNADLKSTADRIVAVDYDSSGRLDNLAIYRPGGRTVWIVQKGAGDFFDTVYQSRTAGSGDGIGGYDMADSRDQLIAFDFDGSGKCDHLMAYRPGVGSLFLLQRKPNSRDYQALLTSANGIGGFRLADADDRLAPFNYGADKPDHLVGYRDNTVWILRKQPAVPNQPPAYASVYTSSTIGGFFGFSGRRVMSFDCTSSGRADHLIVYAPGPRTARGWVTIMKSAGDLFPPVYRSPSLAAPVVVGVHAGVAEYRVDPYPDYKPSQLIKVSGASPAEAYCLCTQDITTSQWAVDKVRRALAKASQDPPIIVSRYVADVTLFDAAGAPIPGRTVTITADSLAEVHVGTVSYQVGPGRPIAAVTNGAGRLSVSVDARSLSSPILTLTTDGLSAGFGIDFAAAVNGYLAGTGSLPSQKGTFDAEALRTAQAVGDDSHTEPLVPSNRWSRDLQPQTVVDHCSTVYSMAAGTPTAAAFSGSEQAQPVVGYVFQNWDPDRPQFQAFRSEVEIAAYHDHRIGHPAYGGFWDDFAQWATDVWEGIKTGAARVAEVVVDVKKSVIKIAIWIGDAIVSLGEIIINSIGQAARAVEAVFQMIADAATRVIDWLKSLFAFKDIWETKKALKSGLLTTLGYASTTVTHFSDISDDWFKEQEQKVRTAFAQAKAYFADSRIGDAQNKIPPAVDASGKAVEADKAQSDPQGNWLINQMHGQQIRHPGSFTVNNTTALSVMGDAWNDFLTKWELSGVGDALGRAVDDIKELLEGVFAPDQNDPGRTPVVLLLDAIENLVIALLEAVALVVRAFLTLAVSVYKTIEEALFARIENAGFLSNIYKWVQERAGVPKEKIEDLTYGDLFLLIGAFMGTVFYKLLNGVDKVPFPGGVFPVIPPPPWHPDHAAFVVQDPPKNSDGLMAAQMMGNFLSGILCTLGGVMTDLPWAPTGEPLPESKVNAFGNAFSTVLGYVAMGYPGIYGATTFKDFSEITAAPWLVWCVFSAPCVATVLTGGGSFKNMEHFSVGPLATTGFGLVLLILYVMGNVHSDAPPVTWAASVLTPVPLMAQSVRWLSRKYPATGPLLNNGVTAVDALTNLASFWATAIGAGDANANKPYIPTLPTQPVPQVGMDYNVKIPVEKGNKQGDKWISGWQVIDGKLPEGLKLDEDTGYIQGNPTAVGTGTTTVTVQCHDAYGPPLYSAPQKVSVPAAQASPVQAVAKYSGDNQTAPTGTRYLTALAVQVTDAAGQALPQAVVVFTAPSTEPSAKFADGTTTCRAVSDSRGLAVATDLIAGSTAGSFRVEAQVPGVSTAAVAFNLACTQTDVAGITPAAASTPQTANIGTTFAHGLTVTVKNAAGAVVPNAWVIFTAPDSGASGTFADGTTSWAGSTGADGTVTAAAFTANGTVGDYTVTATVTGVPGLSPAIFQLGNRKLQAKALTPNGGSAPQNVVVNTRLAENLSVTVTDEQGGPYPNASVTFRAPGTGATGTFPGGKATYQAVTNADGIAVAGEFTANGTKGQYSVVASLFENSSLSTSFTIVNI